MGLGVLDCSGALPAFWSAVLVCLDVVDFQWREEGVQFFELAEEDAEVSVDEDVGGADAAVWMPMRMQPCQTIG